MPMGCRSIIKWGEDMSDEIKLHDRVIKHSGDYQLLGVVVAVFKTTAGKLRYVVEHHPGFLHIYNKDNIRKVEQCDSYNIGEGGYV